MTFKTGEQSAFSLKFQLLRTPNHEVDHEEACAATFAPLGYRGDTTEHNTLRPPPPASGTLYAARVA